MTKPLAAPSCAQKTTESNSASPRQWFRWLYPAILPLLLLGIAVLDFRYSGGIWPGYLLLASAAFAFAAVIAFHLRRQYRSIATLEQQKLALEDALQTARDASGARSDFIAHAGHELRTPISGIVSLAHMAIESDPPAQVRQYLDGIHASSQWMLRLLNDLLDYSRMEAGRLSLDTAPFVFRDVLFETLQPLEMLARGNGILFRVDVSDAIPDRVRGDTMRLRQILVNVVSNAIKFTRKGSVSITAAIVSEAHPNVTIRLSVTDTGPGIPPDQQNRIFAPFEQSDPSVPRLFGGTGLGLTIAADLARLMGGGITVESRPNEGTAFHCRFVLERDLSLSLDPPRDSNSSWRVLVADHSSFSGRFLERALTKRGHLVSLAANGGEAWDLLRSRPFDLLLVDVAMERGEGMELLMRLSAGEQPSLRDLRVVAMTEDAGDLARLSLIKAGAHSVLLKPVPPAELDRILQALPRQRPATH